MSRNSRKFRLNTQQEILTAFDIVSSDSDSQPDLNSSAQYVSQVLGADDVQRVQTPKRKRKKECKTKGPDHSLDFEDDQHSMSPNRTLTELRENAKRRRNNEPNATCTASPIPSTSAASLSRTLTPTDAPITRPCSSTPTNSAGRKELFIATSPIPQSPGHESEVQEASTLDDTLIGDSVDTADAQIQIRGPDGIFYDGDDSESDNGLVTDGSDVDHADDELESDASAEEDSDGESSGGDESENSMQEPPADGQPKAHGPRRHRLQFGPYLQGDIQNYAGDKHYSADNTDWRDPTQYGVDTKMCPIPEFTPRRQPIDGFNGLTFDPTGMKPIDLFYKLWDQELFDQIAAETNRYHSIGAPNRRHSEYICTFILSVSGEERWSNWQRVGLVIWRSGFEPHNSHLHSLHALFSQQARSL